MKKGKKEYILEYDMKFVNILSIIILVIMILLTYGLIIILKKNELLKVILDLGMIENYYRILILFVLMIGWLVLHEVIHSIAYKVMGAKSKNIVFGVALEKGVFYCKCKEYIERKCYMTSLLAPFILIGVVTYILGFIVNSSYLVLLSIINIGGCSGDLMMFNFFLKQNKKVEFKELGYSSPFCLRTTEDIINKKYKGIKSIREVTNEQETNEGPEKKLTITKQSWIMIIVLLIIMLVDCLLLFINNIM